MMTGNLTTQTTTVASSAVPHHGKATEDGSLRNVPETAILRGEILISNMTR